MVVGIVQSTIDSVEASMAELLEMIDYRPRDKALFIKPNVPDSGPPGQGLYTDPAVVDALLAQCPGCSAVIGEGCVVGRSAATALVKNGYQPVAQRWGANLVDLDVEERYEATWHLGRLRLPDLLQSHEYINVAKMKTHIQTGVTLGMKNQKGLLHPVDKRRFHRLGLDRCIQALADVVQPALTIVDGIVALEGNGPWRYGRPTPMGLLVAGTDMIEVDNVCLQLMGFEANHAPHIPIRQQIDTVGLDVHTAKRSFAFDYPGFFRYRNVYEHVNDSCSGCNWSLYRAFVAIKDDPWRRMHFQYRGVWRRLDVIMGHAKVMPSGHGQVLCLGDCACDFAEMHGLRIARGCPPETAAIVRLL